MPLLLRSCRWRSSGRSGTGHYRGNFHLKGVLAVLPKRVLYGVGHYAQHLQKNRLESSIRNQSNVAANQSDARSRIRDADFAEESANLSQQSIIQQAATSMLMQANSRPQLALSMLG